MLNCRLIERMLSSYIDGELCGVEMMRIRRHLQECSDCRVEHDHILRTKRVVSLMPVRQPNVDFEVRLMQHVFDSNSQVKGSRWLFWMTDLKNAFRMPSERAKRVLAFGGALTAIAWMAGTVNDSAYVSAPPLGASNVSVIIPAQRDFIRTSAIPVIPANNVHNSKIGYAGLYPPIAGNGSTENTNFKIDNYDLIISGR